MGRVNVCRADYVFILLLSWIFFQPAGLLAYVMDKGLPFMKGESSVQLVVVLGVVCCPLS